MIRPSNIQYEAYVDYTVWDRTTRIFHWLNVLLIILLIGLGLAIINVEILGINDDGKLLLKTLHTYTGYVFVVNLAWRIVWGFAGNHYAGWKSLFAFGKGYPGELVVYLKSLFSDSPLHYLGHNPAARLIIAVFYVLLVLQALTGLILAGTDLYLPPLGHEIKEYIAGAGEDHSKIANVKPGSKTGIDEAAYQRMRSLREPIVETHEIIFYLLLVTIVLHLAGVIVTEVKEKNAIVSAMITGKKYFKSPPRR